MTIRIHLTSVFVEDQERRAALLYGRARLRTPQRRAYRKWRPLAHRGGARTGRCRAAPRASITSRRRPLPGCLPLMASHSRPFAVDDVHAEYDRLIDAGVSFTQPPTAMGPVTTACLDDTCGNLDPARLDMTSPAPEGRVDGRTSETSIQPGSPVRAEVIDVP